VLAAMQRTTGNHMGLKKDVTGGHGLGKHWNAVK
jgi:hypothetical protein